MSKFIDIGLPEKMEMQHYDEYIQITRKWFGWKTIFVTIFAVIWNSIIFFIFPSMYKDSKSFTKIFPFIFVAAGIVVIYYAIASWFNKTDIFVSKKAVQIKHGPVPWFGNMRLDAADIKQVYGREKISSSDSGRSVIFEVHAVLNSGRNKKLLGGLETREQALFIEQEMEKFLNIENMNVRGELGS